MPQNQRAQSNVQPPAYYPIVDNYNALEAFIRRAYNPNGDPALDARLIVKPFVYPLEFLNLTVATPQMDTIIVASNADFVLQRIACVMGNDDVFGLYPAVEILLTDTGSNERLTQDYVDLMSYSEMPPFGGENPLPYPRIISGRSQLQVDVRNYSNLAIPETAYEVLALHFMGALVQQL